LCCIAIIGAIGLVTDLLLNRLAIVLTPWAEHHKA
jgi:ABC-type nitrate/sulfonate/bicarbonate transport system permease component